MAVTKISETKAYGPPTEKSFQSKVEREFFQSKNGREREHKNYTVLKLIQNDISDIKYTSTGLLYPFSYDRLKWADL